jgi:hypothetical protein
MDLDEMVNDIERAIITAVSGLKKRTDIIEGSLVEQLRKLMKSELTLRGGRILRTQDNIKALNKIKRGLAAFVNSIGGDDLGLDDAFNKISTYIINNYRDFSDEEAIGLANLVKSQSIEQATDLFIAEGINSEVIPELSSIIRNGVINGLTIEETLSAVEELVSSGLINNAAKRITIDSLVGFAREYVNAITSNFDAEWYLFEGALRSSSRSFCESRAGKYFRKSEIESWVTLDWQGKRAGTNKETIFRFVGGYNCYHLLLPVPESIVPEKYK